MKDNATQFRHHTVCTDMMVHYVWVENEEKSGHKNNGKVVLPIEPKLTAFSFVLTNILRDFIIYHLLLNDKLISYAVQWNPSNVNENVYSSSLKALNQGKQHLRCFGKLKNIPLYLPSPCLCRCSHFKLLVDVHDAALGKCQWLSTIT